MRPNNLPLQLSTFIGREREIAEVTRLLERTRLVTLTGAGGCGKTRLALQTASQLTTHADLSDAYEDGVWFVPLAALADPALVPQQAAATFDVRPQPGQPLQAALTNYLREKDLLLLLDNCEHVKDACAQLVRVLLPACPQVRILAASREALNLSDEATYRVPSLAFPESSAPIQAEGLAAYESVRLFVERATAAHAPFALNDKNARAVAHICQRLEGIPLALELAAARVRVLSAEQIAARLDDTLSLLARGTTPIERHQTMRAALDWSHDLLPQPERVLFRRLAIFAGSFDLEAVEQVCVYGGRIPLPRAAVLDLLTSLVEQSLVMVVEHAETARYRLLEPIRQYGREKLEEAKETEPFSQQHLEFFGRLAVEASPQLHRAQQQRWYRRLDAEISNMRAALEWAVTAEVPLAGLRLSNALEWYWQTRGYWREGFDYIAKLLGALEGSALTPSPEIDLLRADALGISGMLAGWSGNLQTERWRLEQSIALARETGAPGRAIVARGLLDLTFFTGNRTQKFDRSALDEATRLARDAGDDWILARALSVSGLGAHYDGDLQTARRLYEESLLTCRRLGDRIFPARPLAGLTMAAELAGDLPAARRFAEESLALARDQGDSGHVPVALGHVGEVALMQGRYAEAKDALQESLALWRKAGSRAQAAHALRLLGGVARAQNRMTDSAAHYLESLQLLREQMNARETVESMIGLASVAMERKLVELAAHWLAHAEALMERTNLQSVPALQALFRRQVEAVRASMSQKAFTEAWHEGRALTQEQVASETERALVAPDEPLAAGLTEREIEVLRLVAQGLTNQEIADRLIVSRRTVHAHMRSILGKLGVSTRTAAAHYAAEHKLL